MEQPFVLDGRAQILKLVRESEILLVLLEPFSGSYNGSLLLSLSS